MFVAALQMVSTDSLPTQVATRRHPLQALQNRLL